METKECMKRISQRDIAKRLGINVSTVSRALNGLNGVSADLRQKIERLAKEQGYSPNPFAASLRYDTTKTIGIVVPDVSFNHNAHIIRRIEAEARKEGYMCIITDSDDKQDNEQVKDHHIPLVLFDRAADTDISSVVINDTDSARQATHYLIDGGARRIAFLGGSNSMKQTADRKHGYLEALRERGIPIRPELVQCHDASFNSGLTDTIGLLDLPEPPDAIIASHGLLALSAFHAVMSRKLRIPEDIAMIGYMSDWISEITSPRMSFVKQNLKEIGDTAFRLLLDQINGDESIKHTVVKAHLEIKDSTRKLPL